MGEIPTTSSSDISPYRNYDQAVQAATVAPPSSPVPGDIVRAGTDLAEATAAYGTVAARFFEIRAELELARQHRVATMDAFAAVCEKAGV